MGTTGPTGANPGGAESASQTRRQALGRFLRHARERIRPVDLGLAPGVRRRTPGLRREEVAQLCDISTTWYTWIEQGRDVTVSPTVCARLATVLKLARAERHYLFELADCADPEHWQGDIQPLPQGLSACVDSISAPAYILDRSWNVLARNEALLGLFDGWPDRSEQPNLLRYIFLDPAARELVVDWEQRASRVVAEFRADVGAHADEADVQALIQELAHQSQVFAFWWGRQTVVEREGGLRDFRHPSQGVRRFQQFTFRLAIRSDCKLVMLLEDEDKPV
ncbi:helix-turn-helix domain-containing protein [Alcaligenes faecalis]|uniref:helix-turn-helix transcriptional regulator n=1 Tax=Alcaligenes faecalis TaxID=511 RepID=UPI000F6898C4|nr:helix-turn-helix transcriptional regulator [Alcaligenes faecalis]MBQ0217730.1 helix-turn-helix domain-containing protein [Alcaligenes faecalis]RSE65089.1 XRE family transcriptional regulator [Alcaligenes faecalis]